MKDLIFVGNARKELIEMPESVRREIGFQLHLLQAGLMPEDFKPMPSVGPGVMEIRARDEAGRNVGRCFYVVVSAQGVAVLSAFIKTSEKTAPKDIQKGRARLKILQEVLNGKKES